MKELQNDFDHYNISHIPRSENQQVDKLAKMASSDDPEVTGLAPVEVLRSPSIDQMEIDLILETEPERESWMTPLKNFLMNGTLSTKKSERRKVIRKAA